MVIKKYFEHYGQKQKKEHFLHLVQIVKVDGKIDEREKELLYKIGKKLHLTNEEIEELIHSKEKISFTPSINLQERFEQIYDMVNVMIVDGVIEENEMKLLKKFAIKLGFEESDMNLLFNVILDGISKKEDVEDLFKEYLKNRSRNK